MALGESGRPHHFGPGRCAARTGLQEAAFALLRYVDEHPELLTTIRLTLIRTPHHHPAQHEVPTDGLVVELEPVADPG
jgi:hypothetical protein